jgi:hypothetical protein
MFRQILLIVIFNFLSIINTQHLPLCDSFDEIDENNSEVKLRRVRALCDAVYSSRIMSNQDELDSIPDFDLTQINSGKDV